MQDLTLTKATDPNGLTVRSLVRLNGKVYAQAVIANWLTEADVLTGGKTGAETIEMISNMILQHTQHRSVGSVLMAIRDGIGYTDDDGKVYGSITWPKVNLWLQRHEQAVLDMVMDAHSSAVSKNDNLGRDWMDQMEKKSPNRLIEKKDRIIAALERKLKSKDQ